MTDELWMMLDRETTENRAAFLAALIMGHRFRDLGDVGPGKRRFVPVFLPSQAERIAVTLVRLAGVIKRYAEKDCNEGLSERDEKALANNSAKFEKIANLAGFDARTGGDPRGACAYLIDPADPKAGDGWGDGWAVFK